MNLKVWQIDAAQMTPYYNIAICQALSDNDCEVRYTTTRYLYSDLTYPNNIEYDPLYFRGIDQKWLLSFPLLRKILRGLYYPFNNLRLFQKIRNHKPDIVHFQWSRLPQFDLPLIQAIQNRSIPIIHTVHDVTPLFEKGDVSKLFDIYRQCDGLIVHSEANKQDLIKTVDNIAPEKVFTLPLVQGTFHVPQQATRKMARSIIGVPENTFTVLFFGSIRDYKGIDILVETIKIMNPDAQDISWLIVGKTNDKTQANYTAQVESLDNVFIYDRYVQDEDVWQYHLAADICVFPYRHIYQSAALITAMTFGLPIIATNIGSFPETIDGNGMLIPSEDPSALRDAILDAYHNWDLPALSQRSLDIVHERHSYEKVGQILRNIYDDIIQ